MRAVGSRRMAEVKNSAFSIYPTRGGSKGARGRQRSAPHKWNFLVSAFGQMVWKISNCMLVLCQKLHICIHITDKIFPVTGPLRRPLPPLPLQLQVLEPPQSSSSVEFGITGYYDPGGLCVQVAKAKLSCRVPDSTFCCTHYAITIHQRCIDGQTDRRTSCS